MNLETRGQKVLIVENDRAILELLQIRLDVAGYHTSVARNGRSALEALRNFRPAALVLELNLPEMNGFEVLEAINPRREKMPYPVLVTAKGLAADHIQRALRLGARDCMTKPFSGSDVLERVSRMLRKPAPPPSAAPLQRQAFA